MANSAADVVIVAPPDGRRALPRSTARQQLVFNQISDGTVPVRYRLEMADPDETTTTATPEKVPTVLFNKSSFVRIF